MDCRFGVVRVLECLSDPQSYRLGTKGRPGRATLDGRVNAFTNAILWSSRMGWGGGVTGPTTLSYKNSNVTETEQPYSPSGVVGR